MLPRTLRTRLVVAVAALVAAAMAVIGAAPAIAHGGGMQLDLNQDGTGRIMVTATYVEDGHQVEEIMDPKLTAMSADGTFIGPISLISASDLGFATWSTAEPLLTAGIWTVTVTTTVPTAATLTEDIEVTVVDTTEPDPEAAQDPVSAGVPWWMFVVLGGVLVILVGVVITVLRIRASRTASSRP